MYEITPNCIKWLISTIGSWTNVKFNYEKTPSGFELFTEQNAKFRLFAPYNLHFSQLKLAEIKLNEDWKNRVTVVQDLILLQPNGENITHDTSETVKKYFLSTIIFMLCRVEELDAEKNDFDHLNRFKLESSCLHESDLLARPIVDELVSALMQYLGKHDIQKDNRTAVTEFVSFSHDLDWPSISAFKSWLQILRATAGDILKRLDLKTALNRIVVKLLSKSKLQKFDKYNSFDFLANYERSFDKVFFLLTDEGDHPFNCDYSLKDQRILHLLMAIGSKGFTFNLHGSFGSGFSHSQLKIDIENYFKYVPTDFQNPIFANRFHLLSFKLPLSYEILSESQIQVDHSLGFSQRAGFRAGTSRQFKFFNLKTGQELNLYVQPLIFMENYLFKLQINEIEDELARVKAIYLNVRKYDGLFTILWHNDNLCTPIQQETYKKLLNFI